MSFKTYFYFILIFSISLLPTQVYSQCSGGTSIGTITPGTSWVTTSIAAGNYVDFAASSGIKYMFSFCQGGGSASFDTQITILDNTGAIVAGAYNDDYCGVSSHLLFTAPATATYRVYITQYNCNASGATATLAYLKYFNDEPCTAFLTKNPDCGTNYVTYSNTGASNTASPGNPGCATYNGADVWFKTVVPFSGSLVVSTTSGTITDGGMAVYKAPTCSGAFSLLSCDDDSGPGNMPQVNLSGLTPGDSIFIRVYAKNNLQSGTFGLYINDPNPTYCYTGSALQNFSTGCIQVTPNLQGQSGCIWNKSKIDLSTSFNYYFFVNLGTNDGNGADGLCFALQNSPAGMSALGTSGQNLGMGGIPNSVAIEFDTFDNTANGYTELSVDHTAISLNGNIATPVAGPVQASATSGNIEDGVNHQVNIDWNAATKTLKVYFDGAPTLTYVNDLVTNVFGGNPLVYWGFSGSTGAYTNTQSICPGSLPGNPLPIRWDSFHATNNGKDVDLIWVTSEELNVKEFEIEKSFDGITFYSIGLVKATGNSKSHNKYHFIDKTAITTACYYRIKEMDLDGNFSYSEIKHVGMSKNQKPHISIAPNPVNNVDEITINYFNEESTSSILIVYDQLGNELSRGNLANGSQQYKLPASIKTGIIFIVVVTENGSLNEKLMIANK